MALLMEGVRGAIRSGSLAEYSKRLLAGEGPYGLVA
jgi:hypothetical protein